MLRHEIQHKQPDRQLPAAVSTYKKTAPEGAASDLELIRSHILYFARQLSTVIPVWLQQNN
jgi:hypothetical protein